MVTLSIAGMGFPIAVTEICSIAVSLHRRSNRAKMDCGLPVNPLIGKAAAVHPNIETGSFESLIADPLPAPAHSFNFARAGFEIVEFTGLSAETLRTDAPGRHQQMRMIVAIVAVTVRGMDRKIDCDAIPSCEPGRELARSLNALL